MVAEARRFSHRGGGGAAGALIRSVVAAPGVGLTVHHEKKKQWGGRKLVISGLVSGCGLLGWGLAESFLTQLFMRTESRKRLEKTMGLWDDVG